jgi:hypothetical protein
MAIILGRQTWPADLAGRLGRQTWPADLAGRLGRQTWTADLVGRLGRQTGPADWAGRLGRHVSSHNDFFTFFLDLNVAISSNLKIESQHCFMLKLIKNQRALFELVDLSDIAVGNVGVPTC